MITSTQHSSSESTCRSSQRGSSAKKPENNKNKNVIRSKKQQIIETIQIVNTLTRHLFYVF